MFVFARFRAANHQFAAEEFFVVQFLHCALGFFDRLHRDEGETFGALIVAIAHDLGVLHVTDPVKEFEEITLGRVEGQIADVETRRRDFDGFGWTLRPRFAVPFAFDRPASAVALAAAGATAASAKEPIITTTSPSLRIRTSASR